MAGMPSLPQLPRPARLGNHPLPHRQGPERAVLQGGPQVVQEPGHAHLLLDVFGGDAVHAGGVRALVARDPAERHDQRRRVVHEVEQVIKPAARISRRPTVKLGLHPRYPRPRPLRDQPGRCHSAARLAALQPPSLLETAAALRHVTGFPGLGLLRRLRPTRPVRRSARLSPAAGPDARRRGTGPGGSRVHCDSLGGLGARLCPSGLATGTPQTFPMASRGRSMHTAPEVPAASVHGGTHRARPISARFEPVSQIEGRKTPVPRVLLSATLAGPAPSGSTGTSRLCQGCSRPPRRHADQAALSYSDLLRQATGEGLSPPLEPQRLTAQTENATEPLRLQSPAPPPGILVNRASGAAECKPVRGDVLRPCEGRDVRPFISSQRSPMMGVVGGAGR